MSKKIDDNTVERTTTSTVQMSKTELLARKRMCEDGISSFTNELEEINQLLGLLED